MEKYKVGDMVECKVSGLEKYGIFVVLENSYSGLIHISEISEGFVRDVKDFVQIGEVIKAKVIEVLEEEKHVKLSIKGINYHDGSCLERIAGIAHGFAPLEEKLGEWTEEKLLEMEEK